ncbi:hypothetical protein [Clostridium vincentii]|uniref:Uncharacterized protein n=1 Tax=Clostridium vincentii TaxID=52704 RepID=A0A2T0B6I2_9CLOT|nr:hypothetical protein [Clostridium vincentii]PRR79499.1 hypothetical protein CLVI_33440 [Clostridium vincentii]
MKKKNIIITLAITMMVGTGITAYASTTPDSTPRNNGTMENCIGTRGERATQLRGQDILTNLLKSKGVEDEEINSALDSGKSLHTLLTDKGVTAEEIKEYMLTEKIKNIDEAVTNGTMTNESGEESKTRITENSANCETPGEGTGKMKDSDNRGYMNRNNK